MINLNRQAAIERARHCVTNNAFTQARAICEDLLRENKRDVVVLEIMAKMHCENGAFDEGIKLIKKCIEIQPNEPRWPGILATIYMSIGRMRDAILRYEKVLRRNPKDSLALAGLADVYQRQGENDKALSVLEPFVKCGTESALMAFIYAQVLHHEKRYAEAIEILQKHIASGPVPTGSPFLLGKCLEKSGHYDEAFEAYKLGNQITAKPFDLNEFNEFIEATIRTFTREWLARMPRATGDTSLPIFIAARPRTGSTLLDKIIGSHPQVRSAGELIHLNEITLGMSFEVGSTLPYPQCVRDLDQSDIKKFSEQYLAGLKKASNGARRVVDSAKAAWKNLGLLQLLLPQCTVIEIRRNAIDNCLACYSEDISAHPYANDLRHLGLTYRAYERLMQHWYDLLDLRMLRVDYEELVADQEGMTRKIIEFCGLEWDDACLRFYERAAANRDPKAILTPSYDQVRKPIYNTSVGRAKKFEKHLGPLIDALAEGDSKHQLDKNQRAQSPAA
jgi:tetratricopeptide (TPR) repeat protein